MISHRICGRHARIFELRLERLLADWAEDIAEQRKLIEHRYSPEDRCEPAAVMNLDREEILRRDCAEALAAIFARERWVKM